MLRNQKIEDRVDILGIEIDPIDRTMLREKLREYLEARIPRQIVTVNTDFLSIARRDGNFVHLLNEAATSVADGMPLVWASRYLGNPLPQRITGTDILQDACELASKEGYSIFLLGGGEGIATEMGEVLANRYPGLRVVGTYTPPFTNNFTEAENNEMVAAIKAASPDMLFVSLGTPKQEKWISEHLSLLNVPLCVGIGGVFNFVTGRTRRAPRWMQQTGLEWLFRLSCEPTRLWHRYMVDDLPMLFLVLRYRFDRSVSCLPVPAKSAYSMEVVSPSSRKLFSKRSYSEPLSTMPSSSLVTMEREVLGVSTAASSQILTDFNVMSVSSQQSNL